MTAHQGSGDETLELVALTLARYGDAVNTKLADLIPQATWDALTERGLINHARDFAGEGTCEATTKGADYLIEQVSALGRGVTAVQGSGERGAAILAAIKLSGRPGFHDEPIREAARVELDALLVSLARNDAALKQACRYIMRHHGCEHWFPNPSDPVDACGSSWIG